MPDKRRRFHSKKLDERVPNGQVILARRQPNNDDIATGNDRQQRMQPKILLKQRTTEQGTIGTTSTTTPSSTSSSGGNRSEEPPQRYHQNNKTTIIQRSNANSGSSLTSNISTTTSSGSSGGSTGSGAISVITNLDKNKDTNELQTDASDELNKQHMRQPVVLITSSGLPNYNVRKVLCKTNNDFLVVGVLGAHGVGKSTVMNLLAYDHYLQAESSSSSSSNGSGGSSSSNNSSGVSLYNDFQRLFLDSDNVFSTKLHNNSATRARTESMHMYVTGERMILIDTPPLLCNTHKREIAHNDLDELRMSINLLHICHLIIIVYEQSLSLDEVRLLHMALHMKALKQNKTQTDNYLPRLLFIKNRASRIDYTPEMQQRTNNIILKLFRDTNLDITRSGRRGSNSGDSITTKPQQTQIKDTITPTTMTTTTTTKPEAITATTLSVNSFLLPEFKSADATISHASLADLTIALRQRVLATSRTKMVESNDFNEYDWFETVIKTTQDGMQKLDKTYETVMLQHLELLNDTNSTNTTGTRAGRTAHCASQSNVNDTSSSVGAIGANSAGRNNERFKERRAYRVMAKP